MRFKLLFVFVVFSILSIAQNDEAVFFEKNKIRTENLAKEALRTGHLYVALSYYEALYQKDSSVVSYWSDLATLYRGTNNYKKALYFYNKLSQETSKNLGENTFYLAQMQKSTGKYDEALKTLTGMKKLLSDVDNDYVKKLYKIEIASCEMAIAKRDSIGKELVSSLNGDVNNVHVEFSPIPVSDSKMIFGSLRETKENVYKFSEEDTTKYPTRKLYTAEKVNDSWMMKNEFSDFLEAEGVDIGNGTFSLDSSRFYFTKCSQNWQYKTICHIYVSSQKGGKWSSPEKLNELVNLPDFTSSHPTVARDVKTNKEILYFVSDREGGKGDLDIWFSEYDTKKKTFKKPRNAGPKINTIGTEMTPYFDIKSRSLYFSSNGRANWGGLDVFKVTHDGTGWMEAVNLGKPVNSPADDIDFVLKPSGKGGFFVSNREGGKSLYHSTCCDDIYEFNYAKFVSATVQLEVKDEKSNECLKNGEKISVYIKDEKGKFLVSETSSKDCKNKIELRPGFDYIIEVKKEGYFNDEVALTTKNAIESVTIEKSISLKKRPEEPIVLANVQFEYGSANLTADSKNILDTTLIKMCLKNPELVIEVAAHTDNVGSDAANLKLSQKRAESILEYIKLKGLDKSHFVSVGYGETKPIAPNTNPDGSDNPKGREKNRRVEFKIIGEKEIEQPNVDVVE